MKKTTLSTVGGVVTAIIASLCCIGPVAVALIGVGSIGAFSVFESYRPYLIGLTVAILGLAFSLTYRKREVKCEDGTCKVESAGKSTTPDGSDHRRLVEWNKIAVWLATFIAAVAIAFPYLGISPSSSANASVVPHASVVLKIEGMDCNACAKGIEGTLAAMKGVHKATVEYEKGEGTVYYDPALVQPNDLIERVNKTGYTASIPQEKKGH